ncbi:glycoside hydrolase family 16 protein [Xylona heveae TC161]|uniref:Glycoside hydrolase family 16 protein n=1 Tax=Xylona heveae (strain CBS 132557 / TC161) TaxID=1328760 RepID=A0A165FAN7_XYLHT|nr:glycoside hydrolase family 16 protein [Xylona heveae TC161]KZF20767.1 glycoside hydrolase family 16 protein [Xylona heveae TC161]
MEYPRSTTANTTATATPMRPGTPDSAEPYGDSITPLPRQQNPFASPLTSRPASTTGSMVGPRVPGAGPNYFHSRRVKRGEAERPWTKKKDPKEKWVTILPLIGILIGLGISGFLIWDGLRTVVKHNYCLLLDEDWSEGFNDKVWTKEVEVGGFGNGQFEMTTNTDENAYIENGKLVIKPTLQDAKLIETNNIINLLTDKSCSSDIWSNCVTSTNVTNGTIVNPVKSARINSKKGAVIKYGRIEVKAQLPAGDWLWPAIWMLPVDSVYGEWPQSGEIDIVESRGNNYTYSQGGNNIVSSALHWGPNTANDAWWRTNVKREALHTTYAKKAHTFGLEWSEKYLFTYIDTRLLQVLYTKFDEPLWKRGNFPIADSNGTRLSDPWSQTGNDATPFDQDFYLIMNVAVGGTNGWFKDGSSGKPWVDGSATAKKDFWNARDQWMPTWEKDGQMLVESVKIWQQQGYNGC